MRYQRSKERIPIRTEHLMTLPEARTADTRADGPPVSTAI
jgi:hypothetical protein